MYIYIIICMQKLVFENRKIYNSSEKMVATPRIDPSGFLDLFRRLPKGKPRVHEHFKNLCGAKSFVVMFAPCLKLFVSQ